jgi:exosome complex RNA-binding protein Csl4
MRLINADTLKDCINARVATVLLGMVDDMPTVNAKIVEHGCWVDKVTTADGARVLYATCSMCGAVSGTVSNYCPECGANMRRREDLHYGQTT